MTRLNEHVHALWELPAADFDSWRRENDLPKLLSFFKQILPYFEEWQSVHAIDDVTFLTPNRPSKFFVGQGQMFLWSSTGPDFDLNRQTTTAHFHDKAIDSRAYEERQIADFGEVRYRTNWVIAFIPYFRWLRTAKRMKRFQIPGQPNAFTSDFRYGRTEAYNTVFSRTFLFHSHPVLKLGGVAIHASRLDSRNLDFVDLDHLRVSGSGGGRVTEIAYASCRSVTLKHFNKPFVTFEKCTLDSPRFENCHLEGFEFVDCGISRPVFRNARLARFVLRRTAMAQASFESCDLIDLTVTAPRLASAEGMADFYKRLRVAFQAQGNRAEAARFYYLERLQELRRRAWPLIPRIQGLPGFFSLSTLYQGWETGQFGARQILKLIGKNALALIYIIRHPKMLLLVVREKANFAADILDWSVWGFGERPRRVFFWMALLIAGFALRYYMGKSAYLRGNAVESISCSLYNFATIGCEHRGRFDSVEGIMGAILLAIMVAGFSNRTRY